MNLKNLKNIKTRNCYKCPTCKEEFRSSLNYKKHLKECGEFAYRFAWKARKQTINRKS